MATGQLLPDESVWETAKVGAPSMSNPMTTSDDRDTLQPEDKSEHAEVKDAAAISKDMVTRALDFLSTATNETIGACLVGLCATTYLILGRVGLVLIGVVCGVVIHAGWEHVSHHEDPDVVASDARKRREKGIDVAKRVLDWRESRRADVADDDTCAPLKAAPATFDGYQAETKVALETFSAAVIRDYVHWWYAPVMPGEESFPSACRQTLNTFIVALSTRLSRKRHADVFLDFLTHSSSIVIVFLSELSAALAASRTSKPQDAIAEYLYENPTSSLANVTNQNEQRKKLDVISRDILQSFLEEKAFTCEPVRVFLQQILSTLVMGQTISTCSKADFLNEWIMYALEERESTGLAQALDAGVTKATDGAAKKTDATVNGSVNKGASLTTSHPKAGHSQTVHRAEEAMERAMQEAKMLNEMIAAEEAQRQSLDLSRSSIASEAPTALPAVSNVAKFEAAIEADAQEQAHKVRSKEILREIEAGSQAAYIRATSVDLGGSSPKTLDQVLATQQPSALRSDTSLSETSAKSSPALKPTSSPRFTLHDAKISILDDSVLGEKQVIKSKPVTEYLLQIEPASSAHPGWMIPKKYADFQSLHEYLRRISVVSGVTDFTERHTTLPTWKHQTKSALRNDLENYLQDALSFQRLAESEAMKRFLEKDQHTAQQSPTDASKTAFTFPGTTAIENVGKGMLDVMASAPKGAATGGKAIVSGVAGVFGGTSLQRKASTKSARQVSVSHIETPGSPDGGRQTFSYRGSTDSPSPSLEYARVPTSAGEQIFGQNTAVSTPQSVTAPLSTSADGPISLKDDDEANVTPTDGTKSKPAALAATNLPPPPSEIPDDYSSTLQSPDPSTDGASTDRTSLSIGTSRPETSGQASQPTSSKTDKFSEASMENPRSKKTPSLPLTSQETTVAVELFFAIINELYTLSSAWTLRLTLLNTAKSFLLRPGNANLEAIRQLLQSTIIDANSVDSAVASYIYKLRENSLPTEVELAAWPAPPSEEEKERKRVKARALLVEKGMPPALTSVMGLAASGEALGKVFDCLQIEQVAQGLVFALTLQAVKAITQ